MSIREQFQPQVDEFISDLESFATGSYLKPEEKEFWDQPFDPAVLPELRSLIEEALDSLERLPDDPEVEALVGVVRHTFEVLEDFNSRHAYAVIEPEEKQILGELITDAAAATGAEDEALKELPDFE